MSYHGVFTRIGTISMCAYSTVGAHEEALTRIGKHERWQYGKERAETRVEAIENAVFEMLTEINKAILGARQVTRQVENFYAGK